MYTYARLFVFLIAFLLITPQEAAAFSSMRFEELKDHVTVIRDRDGIAHIYAKNEHDLYLMQGYFHARDRFFQMDFSRRQASGRLAELLGPVPEVLAADVQLRTIGLRRAAERSMGAVSDEVMDVLRAYAIGVNLYLMKHPLPPEYAPLELTAVEPWTPLDSLAVAKLIAFGLSFDLGDIRRTEVLVAYRTAGTVAEFNGEALYFQDLFRSAPFDPASTVPDAMKETLAKNRRKNLSGLAVGKKDADSSMLTDSPRSDSMALARSYVERVKRLPLFRKALNRQFHDRGSNEWAVSGRFSDNGRPLIANDPHLALDTPATFYQMHLVALKIGTDVFGSSFAGVPCIVLGQNRRITWGTTVNPLDVTDVYQEEIRPDPTSYSGLSTVYKGDLEHIIPIPQIFRSNSTGDGIPNNLVIESGPGIPPAVLIVPRRNNGPILELNEADGTAISLQYTGFSGTREIQTFYELNKARNLDEFKSALQKFDFGSQNFAYADIDGNIAYFTSAEMPLREDLQAGAPVGLPPFFIRNGTGFNEWIPDPDPGPDQAVPYQILPFEEMPQIENPAAGFFVNANNDPFGTTLDNNVLNQLRPGGGIYYLSPGYAIGTRAGRIKQLLDELVLRGDISLEEMQTIQSDVVLLDAQVFTPYIIKAYRQLKRYLRKNPEDAHPDVADLVYDAGVREAVKRLKRWDYSTPTGVFEGYDAGDNNGVRTEPHPREIRASISASIYSVWRSRIIANTIDKTLASVGLSSYRPDSARSMTALRNLFDTFPVQHGNGLSGLNFFLYPGIDDPVVRRDVIIIQSLREALESMAGPEFEAAFLGSTDQQDYRWGRLHRIVFDHPLGEPFSTPPAGGDFLPSFSDLEGIATDGGFGVVDASSHSARAQSSDGFMFDSGPVRRYAGQIRRWPLPIKAETILPGGSSGVLGSPHYADLLGRWLTNDTYPVRQSIWSVFQAIETIEVYKPK